MSDFGLSRAIDPTANAAMTACGTPAYSAPEVGLPPPAGVGGTPWPLRPARRLHEGRRRGRNGHGRRSHEGGGGGAAIQHTRVPLALQDTSALPVACILGGGGVAPARRCSAAQTTRSRLTSTRSASVRRTGKRWRGGAGREGGMGGREGKEGMGSAKRMPSGHLQLPPTP